MACWTFCDLAHFIFLATYITTLLLHLLWTSLLLFSCQAMSNSLWPPGLQHTRLLCSSLSPRVGSNSCQLSWWCYLISPSSAVPSPFAFNLSQHQGLFQWVGPLHQVAKVLELQLQQQSSKYSGLISFSIDWCWSPCCPKDSQESSLGPQLKSINSLALSLFNGPTLTSIYDYQ